MVKPLTTENNFSYLTIALIFLLFINAVLDEFYAEQGQRLVQASIVLTLIIGIWSLKSNKKWYRSGIGFIAALLIIIVANYLFDIAELEFIQLIIILVFFIWSTYLASRQVLFTGLIDVHKIIGSICIYLLMGLSWTILYLLVLEINPVAFNGITDVSWYENFSVVSYYSFVTLTTLGYGDISPAMPVARFLVFMEAIVGVFYMAILVASLIGTMLSGHRNTK